MNNISHHGQFKNDLSTLAKFLIRTVNVDAFEVTVTFEVIDESIGKRRFEVGGEQIDSIEGELCFVKGYGVSSFRALIVFSSSA